MKTLTLTTVKLSKCYIFSDDWSLERIKDKVFQTEFFWICVLDVIDHDANLTYKYNIQSCIANTHLYCPNISAFVRKIKQIKDKALKNNKIDLLQTCIIECQVLPSLGEECRKYGLTETWLQNPTEITIDNVTRKLVLELRQYKKKNQIPDKTCALWLFHLCKLDTLPHLGRLWLSIERMFNKKNKLKSEEKETYLNGKFTPPKPNKKEINECFNVCKATCKAEKEIQLNSSMSESQIKKSYMKLRKEKLKANLEKYNLRKENARLNKKLEKCQEKLGKLSTRNFNKRIKRRNMKIKTLGEQNQSVLKHQKYLNNLVCRIRQKTSNVQFY